MDWKTLLGTITVSVDEELRLHNAYLVAENRILRQQINGRGQWTDSVGRPRVDQEIESLVVQMALENCSWSYDRIVGALLNLGDTISDQTVGSILKRHAIPPAPERKKTMPWSAFIRMHMAVLGATDFFLGTV